RLEARSLRHHRRTPDLDPRCARRPKSMAVGTKARSFGRTKALTCDLGFAADCGCRIERGQWPQPCLPSSPARSAKKQGGCRGAACPLAHIEREARARLLLRSLQCE